MVTMNQLNPVPIALVVCDNIYTESGGKTALVGLFNRITAAKLPITHPQLCVFASVTDIRPNTVFKLDIIHSETDHIIVSLGGPPPEGTTPINIFDIRFEMHNLVFLSAGLYYIRFWGNGHLLMQRPFHVALPETKGTEL